MVLVCLLNCIDVSHIVFRVIVTMLHMAGLLIDNAKSTRMGADEYFAKALVYVNGFYIIGSKLFPFDIFL